MPPTRTATATFTPSPYKPSIIGVQLSVPSHETIPLRARFEITEILNRVTEAGGNWARAPVYWSKIEPQDNVTRTLDWIMTDQTLGTAAGFGLDVIAVVYEHPPWASSVSCGMIDLAPLSRYGDFMRDLVERYDGDGVDDAPDSPRVEYWEIGNEPDFSRAEADGESDNGSCFGDDGGPSDYGDYLYEAYTAVKDADPGAQIVFGAVAYDRLFGDPHYRPEQRGPYRYNFVHDALVSLHTKHGEEDGWPYVDAFALHSFNEYRDNWDGNEGMEQELLGKVAHFRENQLIEEGLFDLSEMPLIAGNVSMSSAPSNEWTRRSDVYQAAYVGQVMARAHAAGLKAAIWFADEDFLIGDCEAPDQWQLFGLLRGWRVMEAAKDCPTNPLPGYELFVPHEVKPSLRAYAAASRMLDGSTFARQLNSEETGSFAVQAYGFERPTGRSGYVAFTDHGWPLGRYLDGTPVPDVTHDFGLDSKYLPGWTGRLRVTDYLGHEEILSGDHITVTLTYKPTYIVVEP